MLTGAIIASALYRITISELLGPSDSEGISTEMDAIRQLRLPWTIIATVDAYPNGDLLDRARALKFVGALTTSLDDVTNAVMSGVPWAAAELEISL